ncbi:glycosyltransferase [Brucella anthropi]|uniref:glycosyltransferase n=1 Tax=Brucella anthropi TaxID=529 RepID=UPI000CFD65F2|nr:glycosyltransferase [Ochrobactrum sp. MYb49]PQZ65576.1 family 2 glycosyl transferase [Ochrobactrum sp. MYb49]
MIKASKTGIVIVSYNASDAIIATLASVRRAHNESSIKLILVDNASTPEERSRIRTAISVHIEEIGNDWRYIEQPENLGFSGGNNIGIREFLADDTITHICLLNGDVIVTDHWLDRMLTYKKAIISSVTNKADSEQCIPVDYDSNLDEFIDIKNGIIPEDPYQRIQDFSNSRHEIWRGNLVEADVTFFCVLLTKEAIQKIGLLDETFFPGGYEDDDYCIRARKLGYEIFLARDVFIHHWGSASFGKLQYEYFSNHAKKNKRYLEKKHKIIWQRRPEKPIVSFYMDVEFALSSLGKSKSRTSLFSYIANLDHQIDYFETEFRNLSSVLKAHSVDVPEKLTEQIAAAESHGDVFATWIRTKTSLLQILKEEKPDNAKVKVIVAQFRYIADAVHERVECNFAIHDFLATFNTGSGTSVSSNPVSRFRRLTGRLSRAVWLARKGIVFLSQLKGIVFFGGYFYPERQSDGYFQRIQIVDRLFPDRWRIYVESEELAGRNLWFDRPEPNVLVLRITGSKQLKMLVRLLALAAVLRTRNIYFHSVLRMYDNRFGRLLHLPFIRKAVDIHGVVPEEFRMHDDFYSALIFDKEEGLAVRKAGIVVVVTHAMKEYLQQKFRSALNAVSISYPMFPNFTPSAAARPLLNGKPIVVYAGGLHKWQQVPKMIDVITKTEELYQHHFYCPDPETVKSMLPTETRNSVVVERKTHAALMDFYPQCHYGFILREDSVVNRVACPTKLVEYIAMGIVPIVDCENIGDFKSLGMRYITLSDFLAVRIPDEETRMRMASENLLVYEKLYHTRQTGAEEIYRFFTQRKISQSRNFIANRLLPPNTFLGDLARKIKRGILFDNSLDGKLANATPRCDVLVQVDNFEAGGLENVVLDLNDTFIESNLNVVLLVLGNAGPAVEQARARGQNVICETFDPASYQTLLDNIRPRLVLTHYSTQGIELCHAREIPFLQVIHNVYMWFGDEQRKEFVESAKLTAKFVAVSDYVRDYSISRLGVPPEKCIVIPNGIDFTPFDDFSPRQAREQLRRQYDISNDDFVFICVGAINHQKNHLGMLKAFHIATHTCTNAKLILLGPAYESALLEEINEYIKDNSLEGRVIYCGTAPRAHEYFAMADAFVSGAFFEGAQLVLLEALRSDVPIITSKVGIASSFEGRPGIEIVAPAVDMSKYEGAIWELKSNEDFEQRLADAMVRIWLNPIHPNLNEAELNALEKSTTYEKYKEMIRPYLH